MVQGELGIVDFPDNGACHKKRAAKQKGDNAPLPGLSTRVERCSTAIPGSSFLQSAEAPGASYGSTWRILNK